MPTHLDKVFVEATRNLLLFQDRIYESSQLLLPDTISKTLTLGKAVKLDHHDNQNKAANQVLQNNNKLVHHGSNLYSNHHHGGKSSEHKHKHQNEFKMPAFSRTINYTTATKTSTTTTLQPTTTSMYHHSVSILFLLKLWNKINFLLNNIQKHINHGT